MPTQKKHPVILRKDHRMFFLILIQIHSSLLKAGDDLEFLPPGKIGGI